MTVHAPLFVWSHIRQPRTLRGSISINATRHCCPRCEVIVGSPQITPDKSPSVHASAPVYRTIPKPTAASICRARPQRTFLPALCECLNGSECSHFNGVGRRQWRFGRIFCSKYITTPTSTLRSPYDHMKPVPRLQERVPLSWMFSSFATTTSV